MLKETFLNQPRGAAGISNPNTNMTYIFQRDIANCMKIIVGEAIAMTEAWIREKFKDNPDPYLAELCILATSTANVYEECTVDHYKGLSSFIEVFKRADERGEAGKLVMSQFCLFIFTSLIAYLFTCREYSIGVLKELDLGTFNYSSLVTLLMMVPLEDRKKILVSLKENGVVGSRWDLSPLVKHIEGFREVIEKRYLSQPEKPKEELKT